MPWYGTWVWRSILSSPQPRKRKKKSCFSSGLFHQYNLFSGCSNTCADAERWMMQEFAFETSRRAGPSLDSRAGSCCFKSLLNSLSPTIKQAGHVHIVQRSLLYASSKFSLHILSPISHLAYIFIFITVLSRPDVKNQLCFQAKLTLLLTPSCL